MKTRQKNILILAVLLSLVLNACAPAMATQVAFDGRADAPAASEMEPAKGAEMGITSNGVSDSFAQGAPRLVIHTANLNIVVLDPGASMDAITNMANEMGGFVVTSNLYKTSTNEGVEVPQADITIRVPAEKLTQAMDTIKAMVEDPTVDILTESVSGQDVTQEYTDTQSRLTNLEAAEKQLQDIMDSATKTEDVLSVYNELVSVREQIEVLKGQVKYYEESAALSAIIVNLHAQASVQPVVIAGWEPVGVARNAIQALIDTLQFLGSALIWIAIFVLPIAIILILVILALRTIWRKIFGSKPRKTAQAQPPAAQPPIDPTAQN
jgi:hypothetical protein